MNTPESTHYVLTSKGRIFIEGGGYAALFNEQGKIKELQEKQITSVIETNLSVRKTNRIQIGSIIITGLAIVGSCIFQWQSVCIQKEQLNIQKKQDAIQKASLILDSIRELSIKNQFLRIQKQIDSLKLQKF